MSLVMPVILSWLMNFAKSVHSITIGFGEFNSFFEIVAFALKSSAVTLLIAIVTPTKSFIVSLEYFYSF